MKNAIALGTFDGVHSGHRKVLTLPQDCRKIAVTFSVPPKAVLTGKCELITSHEQKCEIFKKMGIDEILTLDFNEVRNMHALDFLDFINEKYNPCLFSCGFNYNFGKNGEGNTEILKAYCENHGITFKCSEPATIGDEVVSSTYIRSLLKNGEIRKANELLTVPFSFKAEVISGHQRGRTIGFPTVNQKYPENMVKLKFGVYKTKIRFDGKEYEGITDIGIRPTFETDYVISETYIKNFTGNLYGKELEIIPLKFLRGEKKFSSLEELKEQIKADLQS